MEETPLSPVLLRFPLVDRATGLVTRPWQQWFIASWHRQGGANAPPNNALGDGVGTMETALEETQAALAATQAELDATQAQLAATQAELDATQAELAATQAELAATQADLAATQADLAATQAELDATQDEIDALLPDGTPLAVARYQADGSGVEASPTVLIEALAGEQLYTFGALALHIGTRLLPVPTPTVTQLVFEGSGGTSLALQSNAGSAINVLTIGGTLAAPAVTPTQSTLFAFNVRGHDGTAPSTVIAAQLRFRSEQAFTAGFGSYLEIRTGRLGAVTAATEKVRVTAQGNLRLFNGVGTSPVEGTNAEGVIVLKNGVAPTAAHPADAVQAWAADRGATAGKSSLHVRTEDGTSYVLGDLCGIGTTAPTAPLDINGDTLRLRTARTPASATAAGNQGDFAWDSSHLFICTATNTWRRVAHATW